MASKIISAALGMSLLLLATTGLSATHRSPLDQPTFAELCSVLAQQSLSGGVVTSAQFIAEGHDGANKTPDHCKVQGKLNPHKGVDGKQYAIGFELRLPRNWNQRFYFQGGGGTDGVLRPALGLLSSGGIAPSALSQGFAVVSTDAGHLNQPGIEGSYLFGADPQARIDYGYNHLPVVTAAAKTLIDKAYGHLPKRSYFVGCSNGGREAMMATQRYPELFDGVIAGAPAYRVVEASIDAMAQTQLYAGIAPLSVAVPSDNATAVTKVSKNQPLLGNAFSAAELTLISRGILQACDALDGARDGMVNDIRGCQFDPVALQCPADAATPKSNDAITCLPENKVVALKAAFAGARADDGQIIYSTWPYDPGIASRLWSLWKLGPPDVMPPQAMNTTLVAGALSHVFVTPPIMIDDLYGYALTMNPQETYLATTKRRAPFLLSGMQAVDADSSDVTDFKLHGGKIIFYHGMADGIFSPTDTVSYFQQLQNRFGKEAANFSRLYLIPGMAHCSGGPATDQFDAVSALLAWVEEGKAPDTIIAKARTSSPWPGRTRPLCAYPKQARYSGKGSLEDAANFSCR